MPPYNIPGGAMTQVAQQSGNPAAVGLSSEQAQQARDMVTPQQPIPPYDSQNFPEYSPPGGAPPQEDAAFVGQEASQEATPPALIQYRFNGPNDKVYSVKVPEGITPEQAMQKLRTLSPEELVAFESKDPLEYNLDKYTAERFALGFEEGENISKNVFKYSISHVPSLADHFMRDAEGNTYIGHEYGDDFDNLTPQQRRDRMSQVDAKIRAEKYAEAIKESEAIAAAGGTDYARIAGNVAVGVADPIGYVPVLGQINKVKQATGIAQKTWQATKSGAKVGAVFGAGFEASSQLADTGLPTPKSSTLSDLGQEVQNPYQEFIDMGLNTAKGAGLGLVAGATLGAGGGFVLNATKAAKMDRLVATSRYSPSKAKKLLDKYQNIILVEKANGATGADAHKAARESLRMTTADLYAANRLVQTVIETPSNSYDAIQMLGYRAMESKIGSSAGLFIQATRPIDSRLFDDTGPAGKKVYGALQGMEQNTFTNMHKFHQRVLPFRAIWKSFSKSDRAILGEHLYNKNFTTARAMIEATHGSKGVDVFNEMVSAIEDLGAKAKAAGIKYDDIQNYFPRYIKDLDALTTYLGSEPKYQTAIDHIMDKKRRGKISEAEAAKQINRMLSGKVSPKIKKMIKATKTRKVQEITPEMLQFYDDPITSIDLHIRDMSGAIERRKMFGDSIVINKDGSEDLSNTIGNYLARSGLPAGSKHLNEITSILKSRFGPGDVASNRKIGALRAFVSAITLGNPVSASLQLTDVGVTAWNKGLYNTLRGMPRASLETMKATLGFESSKLNADTAGWMLEMVQELNTGGYNDTVRKYSDNLIRYGGFKLLDRFGKNVTIQASLQKSYNLLRHQKGTRAFMDKWAGVYEPADLTALMSDLKNKRVTDIVKAHIFAEVTEIQPISRSQMPQMYLDLPNGRVFWQFKTWGLKQFDQVRKRVLNNLFSTSPAKAAMGAKELVLLYTYVGAAGVTAKEVQNWIMLRDSKINSPSDFADEAFMAVMGNIMFDRWSMQQILERQDFKAAATNYVLPPSLVIPGELAINIAAGLVGKDGAWQAAFETTSIGRIFDSWTGGAEEYNKKLLYERAGVPYKK